MKKILANDGIHPAGKKYLEDAGFFVETNKIPQNELESKLNEYEAVIVRSATKIRQDLIEKCPNLKVIARAGVGLDNIDVDFAKSKNIPVVNTPSASSSSVAELVFGHFLSLSRGLHDSNKKMHIEGDKSFKKLKKSYAKGSLVQGKTLGIIGIGRIGRETAKIGFGFGMNVIAYDPFIDSVKVPMLLPPNVKGEINVTINTIELDELLAQSDYISIHVPSQDKPLIGAHEFSIMKNDAIIVNASRGGIIDEKLLSSALNDGQLRGIGLDVFNNEPTPAKDILENEKISLSPHIGASTVEAQKNIGMELAHKIVELIG